MPLPGWGGGAQQMTDVWLHVRDYLHSSAEGYANRQIIKEDVLLLRITQTPWLKGASQPISC